jgi:predicted amidohydrolase
MPCVAAIQMCSADDVQTNLVQAKKLIAQAIDQKAQLIILPEMFAIFDSTPETLLRSKEPFGDGPIQDFLATQAQQHQTWILGGTIPISCNDPNKFSAASLLYDATGRCVARYDKMHLFDVTLSETEYYRESDISIPGNQYTVISTPVGKLGIAVCFDLRFPDLFQQLSKLGAEILAIPAAFTVKTGQAHWELLTRCRAIDNFCYLIGAGQGGTHAHGRQTHGHSLIVHPWGNVMAQKDDTHPGVITAEIDLKALHEVRRAIPIHKSNVNTDLSLG